MPVTSTVCRKKIAPASTVVNDPALRGAVRTYCTTCRWDLERRKAYRDCGAACSLFRYQYGTFGGIDLLAVAAHCAACMSEGREAAECRADQCPLWGFRTGERPERTVRP
jgi:hypothetical protein